MVAQAKGTTVIHGNHGFFTFDGQIIGRAKNVNMSVEGGADEFYEVGSAWITDVEVINRKVAIEIERGSIDFKLLSYSVGVQAVLDTDGNTTTFKEGAADNSQFNLIINEDSDNVLSVSPDKGETQVLTSPFTIDVVIAANKITSATEVTTYFVTARDCKIIRHGIAAPNSAYWTTNMSLIGKQIHLGGIAHPIT